MEEELDVLLVSCGESKISQDWSEFLVGCFQNISNERSASIPAIKLQNVKLEDVLISLKENGTIEKYPEARVQIVIICPTFLQKIYSIKETETSLDKLFRPEKVVALMLGVQEQLDNDRIKTVIPKYEQWRKMKVKDMDSSSAEDFLGVAMDLLSKSRQIQEALCTEQQHIGFSIMPKKIKVGQNRILVLLNEPLSSKDDIKITIDKSEQHMDVGMIKRRNPYTVQFTVPASCFHISTLVYVCVEKNGKSLGKRQVKCESRMRELDQMLRTLDNPIHFMCQSFGLNTTDREKLDTFLCDVFQKNIPPDFNLLNPRIPENRVGSSNEEFPTLLHFTAKYGLEKLCWKLMDSPGGEQACHVRNISRLTPAEIAERNNHPKLAKILNNYAHMTGVLGIYNYLKEISSDKEKSISDNNYILPKPVEDTYLIPPAARPVETPLNPPPVINSQNPPSDRSYVNVRPTNFPFPILSPLTSAPCDLYSPTGSFDNYDVPPPSYGRPYTPHTPNSPASPIEKKFEEGYLLMNPKEKGNNMDFGSISSVNTNEFHDTFDRYRKRNSCEGISSPTDSITTSSYGSAVHLYHRDKFSLDEELLDLINYAKNDKLTIEEVENLVKEWQNRNDVKQSLIDREAQLNRMREEYERIQRKMKEHMKRTTPFEKIRRFFSRGKSKRLRAINRARSLDAEILQSVSTNSTSRPYSNISIHSSSSSASSRTNSMSSGSGGAIDNIQKSNDRSKFAPPVELKLAPKKSKLNQHVEKPSKNPDLPADNSEYVQPDNVQCNPHRTRLSSCGSSVLNDTIHECVENDNLESYSNSEAILEKRRNTYHTSNVLKQNKNLEQFRTYSLRFDSKKKSKNMKNKVKSAEDLIHDANWVENDHTHDETAINSGISEATTPSGLSVETLCAQTIQCLSGLADEPHDDDMPVSSTLSFEFNKVSEPAGSSTQSECGSVDSRQNSSLDLSSLSLSSNCTVDENGDIKCSLEFKITEEGEIETENAPPVCPPEIQCVNICASLPEYANVTIQNSPSLTRRCEYTIVSS